MARDADVKIYLRMPREQMPGIQDRLARLQRGGIPVFIHLPEEKITLLCPKNLWLGSIAEAQTALMDPLLEEDIKVVRKN